MANRQSASLPLNARTLSASRLVGIQETARTGSGRPHRRVPALPRLERSDAGEPTLPAIQCNKCRRTWLSEPERARSLPAKMPAPNRILHTHDADRRASLVGTG